MSGLRPEDRIELHVSLGAVRETLCVHITKQAELMKDQINRAVTPEVVRALIAREMQNLVQTEGRKIVAAMLRERFQAEVWAAMDRDPELRNEQRRRAHYMLLQIKSEDHL
jgi:hypothetical protein